MYHGHSLFAADETIRPYTVATLANKIRTDRCNPGFAGGERHGEPDG